MPDATSPFRDGDASFGSFYPKNYVLAWVADEATAEQAANALRDAGFGSDDVVVASGEDVVAHDTAAEAAQGFGARLRGLWSRLYTDEAKDADGYVALARAGAAAVLAYAPSDEQTTRAADALKPFDPKVLRKYGAFTTTDLN